MASLLNDENPRVRLAAAWAMWTLDPANGEYVRQAVPRLTEALAHPEPRVRFYAARTLGEIGPPAASAVADLRIRVREDQDERVRFTAVTALAAFGALSSAALPDLLPILDEHASPLRRAALYAVGRIGPPAKPVAGRLMRDVQHGPVSERPVAAWALVRIDPTPEHVALAIPELLAALDTAPHQAVAQLVMTLGDIGRGRPDVDTALNRLADHDDPAIRVAVKSARARLKSPPAR
jgi:HEAT repeat protein